MIAVGTGDARVIGSVVLGDGRAADEVWVKQGEIYPEERDLLSGAFAVGVVPSSAPVYESFASVFYDGFLVDLHNVSGMSGTEGEVSVLLPARKDGEIVWYTVNDADFLEGVVSVPTRAVARAAGLRYEFYRSDIQTHGVRLTMRFSAWLQESKSSCRARIDVGNVYIDATSVSVSGRLRYLLPLYGSVMTFSVQNARGNPLLANKVNAPAVPLPLINKEWSLAGCVPGSPVKDVNGKTIWSYFRCKTADFSVGSMGFELSVDLDGLIASSRKVRLQVDVQHELALTVQKIASL